MSAAEILRREATGPPPFAFIVACGRSGTTLLRAILDSHPDMAIPPETKFIMTLLGRRRRYESGRAFDAGRFAADLRWAFGLRELDLSKEEVRAALDPPPGDTPDAIRRVFAAYAERRGKSRYGNKTPVHVLSVDALASAFPEARFVHIIRDGRDVALSYLDADIGPDTVEGAALRWRRWVTRGRRAGAALAPGRYLEIRYEDLVGDADATVRTVCSFLDLAYAPSMMRYFERADEVIAGRRPEIFKRLHLPPTKGLREWRREMSARDAETFAVLAGDLLGELGYEIPADVGFAARLRARAGAVRAEAVRAGDLAFRATIRPIRRRIRRPKRLAATER